VYRTPLTGSSERLRSISALLKDGRRDKSGPWHLLM